MTKDDRPDPDALLKAAEREQQNKKKRKGRLRIFFGMSAGVGKTYAMLRAAHQRLHEGVDVVVGIVETHGRKETTALVENLPVIPRKQIEYKGTIIREMDLDAIIERSPQLVLVDELAHTNAPGSRHEKRYQDVLELIDRGIDVYSTVNVQHLESRKESVEAIAQISIRETVPDSILEEAYLLELVDIAPSELLKRLKEGKVYLGEKAEHAAQNFFKEDKLTALREIALRLTAERVDQDLRRMGEARQVGEPWKTNERLMVAISHSPYSQTLIRTARRIAYNLEAPWVAVYVDTGLQLNHEDSAQLAKNIQLARELNAEVLATTDTDIANALMRIGKQKNVTQVILGRPTPRPLTDFLGGGTLLDRFVRESGAVDVHVVRQEIPVKKVSILRQIRTSGELGSFNNYWWTLCFIFGIALLSAALESLIGYRAVGFLFLLAVLGVGMLGPMSAVLFAAVLSAVSWNFFFIPPRLTFAISEPEDVIMCISYFVVALTVGYLTRRIRRHEKILREREERANTLYEISQDIAGSQGKGEFLVKVNERMGRVLNGTCGVLLRNSEGNLVMNALKSYSPKLKDKEMAVATWAFESGKAAGWSTDTLSEAKCLYLPLKSLNETVGVFVYRPHTKRKLNLEQENLLYTAIRQLSVTLEKHFYQKRLREAERLHESEKLHQALLNSISHELRTPLTVIVGTATALADESTPKNGELIAEFGQQLLTASHRLDQVIENLLDMSRISSGGVTLKKELHDIEDLIGVVLNRLKDRLKQHSVSLQIQNDLPMVPMDFRLMDHALGNLILNATLYTPAGTQITISSQRAGGRVRLEVSDDGPGIPEDSVEHIFEKFYRVPGTAAGGTGLGLSIAKGIVDAHHGVIALQNRAPTGCRFIIELPVEEVL